MRKTFYLEGERVTRKHVRELIGEERFMHIMDEALETFGPNVEGVEPLLNHRPSLPSVAPINFYAQRP